MVQAQEVKEADSLGPKKEEKKRVRKGPSSRRRRAAVTIQKSARRYLAVRLVARLREQEMRQAETERRMMAETQRRVAVQVIAWALREGARRAERERTAKAAVVIQALARKHLAVMYVNHLREDKERRREARAARVVTRAVRLEAERRQQKRRMGVAATIIAGWWMERARERRERRPAAAIILQSRWRCHVKRRQCIQTMARKAYQRLVQAAAAKRRELLETRALLKAVSRVAAAMAVYMVVRKTRSALCVQKMVRAYLQRRHSLPGQETALKHLPPCGTTVSHEVGMRTSPALLAMGVMKSPALRKEEEEEGVCGRPYHAVHMPSSLTEEERKAETPGRIRQLVAMVGAWCRTAWTCITRVLSRVGRGIMAVFGRRKGGVTTHQDPEMREGEDDALVHMEEGS